MFMYVAAATHNLNVIRVSYACRIHLYILLRNFILPMAHETINMLYIWLQFIQQSDRQQPKNFKYQIKVNKIKNPFW